VKEKVVDDTYEKWNPEYGNSTNEIDQDVVDERSRVVNSEDMLM